MTAPDRAALEALIAAVEAGSATNPRTPGDHGMLLFFNVFPPTNEDKRFAFAHDAYRGSLDAAKALHEALLPGWRWNLWAVGGATVWNDVANTHLGDNADPARAWLLAILRAKLAETEGT